MGKPQPSMTAPPSVYRQRRARLAAGLRRPMVLFAGQGPARNYAANAYPFRAGSTYLYFGGPPIENAALLIEPGTDGGTGCTLFRTLTAPDDLVWMGAAPSDEDVAGAAGLRTANLAAPETLVTRTHSVTRAGILSRTSRPKKTSST